MIKGANKKTELAATKPFVLFAPSRAARSAACRALRAAGVAAIYDASSIPGDRAYRGALTEAQFRMLVSTPIRDCDLYCDGWAK
jgi:hypothetical protein